MDATDMWHKNGITVMNIMEDVYKMEAINPSMQTETDKSVDWNKVKGYMADGAREIERANALIWEAIKDDTP